MHKFKIGDKVILKKGIQDKDFHEFGNLDECVESIKVKKFLTIKTIADCSNGSEKAFKFLEICQFWRAEWFTSSEQLEFDFDSSN
jgi:hypothetical protein